jgi:hypothetical protein
MGRGPGVKTTARGFIASLRSSSAFVRMLNDINRVPLRSRLGIGSNTVNASTVQLGKPTPAVRMDLFNVSLEPSKVQSLVVLTEELLFGAGPAAEAQFGVE